MLMLVTKPLFTEVDANGHLSQNENQLVVIVFCNEMPALLPLSSKIHSAMHLVTSEHLFQ
jgi:hypothetical protein